MASDQELAALLEAASLGPWQTTHSPTMNPDWPGEWGLASADNYEIVWRGMSKEDARLAAQAPALAQEVLDLRERIEELERELRTALDWPRE